jgi:hypothetical protein
MHCPAQDFRESAALAASICALPMAAVYSLCRLGFSDDLPGPVLMSVGLSWFLINFPFAVKRLWTRARTASSWMASDGALSLIGLVAVMLLGMSLGKAAGVAVAVCGAWFLLDRCRFLAGGPWLRRTSEALFWGTLLGTCLACWIWGDTYHDPLLRWGILNGSVHMDQLFHASMTNMIRTYGVPSTGLDGVPFMPYHFGSHFLLAQLGKLLDLPGIDVYQLTYPIVFLPLLVHSIVTAGLAFAPSRDATLVPRPLLIWPIILMGFVGVLPFSAVKIAGVGWVSDLTSESMCTAVIALLLGLAAAAPWLRRRREASQAGMTTGKLLALMAFPVFVASLGLLKSSVMAVVLGASTLVYITTGPLRRNWLAGLGLALAYAAFLGVSPKVRPPGATHILPFSHLRLLVEPDWWGYYPLLELQILLAALALRLWQEKCGDITEFLRLWRAGDLVDLGFAGFAAAISFLPGLILDIGSATTYFTNVPRWIALPIVLGSLLSVARRPPEILPWKGRLMHLPLWKLGAGFLLLSVGATLALDTASQARSLARTNLGDRGFPPITPSDTAGTNPRAAIKQALRQGHPGRASALIRDQAATQQARRDPHARMIVMLADLYRLPAEEKRVTLLYIPKTNRTYWDLLRDKNLPWVTSFVAPALSGLALLDGLPDAKYLPRTGSYGFGVYDQPEETCPPSGQARDALCQKAERMGFQRILVLDEDPGGAPRLHEWCFGGAHPLLER